MDASSFRVIGIDPGSRYTGYGIVEFRGPHCRHIASGRINASKGEDFSDRLNLIYSGLRQVLDEFPCSFAAAETVFVGKNVMSTIKLGQARGVALLALNQANLPLSEYAPTEVKQAVTGRGRAVKDEVQIMVRRILGIPPESKISEDASDALAIAICHGHTLKFEQRLES